MTDIYSHSLEEVRLLLLQGKVSPSEVVTAVLNRIDQTNPQLNSCSTIMREEALALAKSMDGKHSDAENMPLWGVPVTVKDVFCTKGTRTTCSSHMLEHFVPPYDAVVVEKLRKAGAIIVAKTNMDEFAMGSATEFSLFGATSNPWDIERVPGGSSGGSAASVSAMQGFGSLGSDTGGSIRQPAGLCGCVGIKPTYGRVSRYGTIAYASSFDQPGSLARNVADCAAILSVIAGYDSKDSTSADLPVPSYADAIANKSLKGKVLGMPKEYWEQGLSDEVMASCQQAIKVAESLGATIKEVSLPSLTYSVATYYILATAEASTNLARFDGIRYGSRSEAHDGLMSLYTATRSAGFGEEVKRRILLGTYVLSSGYYDAYYKKASQVRRLIREDYEKALLSCDALLAPASPVTAWKKGTFSDDPLTAYKMDILTLSLNLAGLPGISLPVGLGNTSRLPVGMQIMGKAFDEEGIIAISAALESALPPLGVPSL